MADKSKKPRTLTADEMEKIYQSFSSPDELNSLIGIARGETPGDPGILAGWHPDEISQLDRYTDTRRMHPLAAALYSLALAPAWEGYKATAMLDPATRNISNLLAKAPPELSQFSISGPGVTSAPSLANLAAPFKGMGMGIRSRLRR